MGKVLILLLLMSAQIFPSSGNISSQASDVQQVSASEITPIKKTQSLGMELTAKSAVVFDRRSKKILFDKSADEIMAMASMTKLMTAIVFMEDSGKKLSDHFIVPESVVEYGGSGIGLVAGEEITYKDLLWGALIGSGNDAAESLALSVGDRNKFIDLMNQKAQKLGLKNSHFESACGLDVDDHYSTATDMAKILDYALDIKELRTPMTVKKYEARSLNSDVIHYIGNTNRLLNNDYPRMEGGKTGYTDAAGFCLASFSKDKKGNEIIIVVMNSDLNGNQFQDTKALVDWTFGNYKWQSPKVQ